MPYQSSPYYWIGSSRPNALANESFEPSAESEKAIDFAKQEQGFVLVGPPGTGKTTIMNRAASWIKNPKGGAVSYRTRHLWLETRMLWTHAIEYTQDIKREIDLGKRWPDFDDNYSASGISQKVACLFVDDLGTEQATEYNVEMITLLIDTRYRHQKPTWFTTNLGLDQLAQRYGKRTVSRLREMCKFIKVDGIDRRMRGQDFEY